MPLRWHRIHIFCNAQPPQARGILAIGPPPDSWWLVSPDHTWTQTRASKQQGWVSQQFRQKRMAGTSASTAPCTQWHGVDPQKHMLNQRVSGVLGSLAAFAVKKVRANRSMWRAQSSSCRPEAKPGDFAVMRPYFTRIYGPRSGLSANHIITLMSNYTMVTIVTIV